MRQSETLDYEKKGVRVAYKEAFTRNAWRTCPDPSCWHNSIHPVSPLVAQALDGLKVGDDIIVVTWLHKARRETLKVHPRSDKHRPLTGVFATRSPDRPNPLGLHRVTVRRIAKNKLLIGPIEAIDGTPVVDIKPVIGESDA